MKFFLTLCLACAAGLATAAAQTADLRPFQTFSIGGGGLFVNDFTGGFMDAGFPIATFENADSGKTSDIRNHVRIGGGADTDSNMQFMIRDRFIYGTYVPVNPDYSFRKYFFADVGMLFFESEKTGKTLWSTPLLFETCLGSGFEFLLFSNSAIFIENGLGLRFVTEGSVQDYLNEKFLFGYISIGSRRFF